VPVTVVVADELPVEFVEPDADDEELLDADAELEPPDVSVVAGTTTEASPPCAAATLEEVEVW